MAQMTDKKSRAQQTAEELSTLIYSGTEFLPGDRLPNEIELSTRFGVSRTTLREAIRTLSVHGIVEVRHGIGTFVAQHLPTPTDYGFQDVTRLKIDIQDLFEARLIFEPAVAALAVQRATDAQMEELYEIERRLNAAYRTGEDVSEYDRLFHNTLVQCAHNPFLEQIITIINDAINNLLMIIDFNDVQELVVNDHRYIMEFIMRKDPIGVKSAMKVHILHSMQLLDAPDTIRNSDPRAFL